MSARPVQISLDQKLLRRVDGDPETRKRGRSAFIRSAILLYLDAKRRREIDDQIRHAYSKSTDDLLEEARDLMGAQAWPRP